MSFSRRDFIRAGLVVGAGSVLGRRALAGESKNILAAVEGSDPEKMVRRAFELLGGVKKFVAPGSRVVVKPNASFANPADWGNNTDPRVATAVCRMVMEAGARKVSVVDYPLMRGAEALEINGMAAACKAASIPVSVLGKQSQFRKVKIPRGKVLKEVEISREVLDADMLINLPVAKAHDAVAASIGLKNLMGVIWDRAAFHTMMEINQAIADLSLAVRPQLTLVDMLRVMTTNGPKGPGEIESPNLVVACADPVAADAFCLSQVRFNGRKFKPKQLKYLRFAAEAGLGEINAKQLKILREKV